MLFLVLNTISAGGDAVTAKLRDSNGLVTPVDIIDNGNGTYSGTFKPTIKGLMSVFIYIREKPLQGSPFDVTVTAGIEIEKTGPMLLKFGSHGVLGQSKINDDNFEPWGIASNGSGLIVVTDHNNHHILVCLNTFLSNYEQEGQMRQLPPITLDKGLAFVSFPVIKS